MNDSKNKYYALAITVRWIARIWSITSVGLILFIVFGYGFNPEIFPRAGEIVELIFFPIGIIMGMIMAWKWEGIGAIITIGSLLAFYIIELIRDGALPEGVFFVLLSAPGFFFLIYWLLLYKRLK